MIICFSGKSAPSAARIAEQDGSIQLNRGNIGDVNWGRATANTQLNPDISNATNKRVMRELFREHGVPMPTLLAHWESQPEVHQFPIVGRPDFHSRARGFWLCNNHADVAKALRGTRRKKAATHFMEFVEAEREYRVHVFKGKSIRISEKAFFTDEFGRKDYTTAVPQHKKRPLREAAKLAVEALGLDFGAVDILAKGENNEQVWVLEVNAAPGLGGSMPRLYAETFKQYFEED